MKLFEIYGYAPKGSIIFHCQAIDEADAKSKFKNAAQKAGYGPVIWDLNLPGGPQHLCFIRPQPVPQPLEWGRRDFELSIREVALNQIREHP